jgi:hypothetical protein
MLSLEILYNGQPVEKVPENSRVELCLSNNGTTSLSGISVQLVGRALRSGLTLSANEIRSFEFGVEDLVGELEFTAISGEIKTGSRLEVYPTKISPEELAYIKTERLPALLSRLDAPNRLTLRYSDETIPAFEYISPDFTAEKLLFFSDRLREINQQALERLDYATPPRRERGYGYIKGGVRWNETLREWLNHPELEGLRHEWEESPRTFVTLPNLLLAKFNLELAVQFRRLLQLLESSKSITKGLKRALPGLNTRAEEHFMAIETRELASLRLLVAGFEPSEVKDELEDYIRSAINPVYVELLHLWENYSSRFVSLPREEETPVSSGLQPVGRIYELWCACEIALGLGLSFDTLESGSTVFAGQDLRLYYNKGMEQGWYSTHRRGIARPDVRLVNRRNGRTLLLDMKYRRYSANRAHPDDVYKMLAYMNDFEINCGGIVYPAQGEIISIENGKGQRFLEIPLRPLPGEGFGETLTKLGKVLQVQLA